MTLLLTVVADVVSPWCFLGHLRLDLAIARIGDGRRLRKVHRPFLLDGEPISSGSDARGRPLADADPVSNRRKVEEAAQASGLSIQLAPHAPVPSSLPAHTLLRLAIRRDTQSELLDSIFTAYFLEGRDISQLDTLAQIAARHGFDDAEVRTLLADPAQEEETQRQARLARSEGIQAVPHYFFDGSSLSGVQPVDVLERALRARLGDLP